jgi:hypothetical protein
MMSFNSCSLANCYRNLLPPFLLWTWRQIIPPESFLYSAILHGVISQNTVIPLAFLNWGELRNDPILCSITWLMLWALVLVVLWGILENWMSPAVRSLMGDICLNHKIKFVPRIMSFDKRRMRLVLTRFLWNRVPYFVKILKIGTMRGPDIEYMRNSWGSLPVPMLHCMKRKTSTLWG